MRPVRALALMVVLVAISVLAGCGGGGVADEPYPPVELMMENPALSFVSCGDPHGPNHVYTCRFHAREYQETGGVAEIILTGGGKAYKVEHCEARSRNMDVPQSKSDPCAVLR